MRVEGSKCALMMRQSMGLADIARYVIQRNSNPRFLSETASYDMASMTARL
jgi:hypothetical protein